MPSPSFAPSLILSLYALGSRRKDSSVEKALLCEREMVSLRVFLLCFVILLMFLHVYREVVKACRVVRRM